MHKLTSILIILIIASSCKTPNIPPTKELNLTNISPAQNIQIEMTFIDSNSNGEKNIINTLDIQDSSINISNDKRMALNKVYNWLPLKTSNVIDLFVFGKLNYDEIAHIKGVDAQNIKNIIHAVGKTFRKNLN